MPANKILLSRMSLIITQHRTQILFLARGALHVEVSAALPHPAPVLTHCGSLCLKLSTGLGSGSRVAADHLSFPKEQLWS